MKILNGFMVIPLLIIALIGIVGVVSAGDVSIESACGPASDHYLLASDNLTFNFTDLSPVSKRFYITDRPAVVGTNLAADNYSGSIAYYGTTDVISSNSSKNLDNYLNLTFPTPGRYLLTWIGWNGSNSCDPQASYADIYAGLPILGAINQTFPTYQYQARFQYNTSLNSSIPNTIIWNYGDGSSPDTRTDYPNAFNHTFPYSSPYSPVAYNVNATAKNNTPTLFFDNYTTYSFTMYPPPVSVFNITDNYTGNLIAKGPAPVKADLNYLSRTFSSAVDMYPEWNLSDGSALNHSDNFTHTFDHPGVYNVTLKTSTMYGWNLTNHTLMVYDNITSNFTSTQYSCASFPVNVTFRDNSTGSNSDKWAWDYGDGTSSGNLTVNWTNHTYYSPLMYNVTLLAINNTFEISNQSSQWVNVDGLFANFTWEPTNRTILRGSNALFNFTDTSTGGIDKYTRFLWEFEPGHYSYYQNDSYNFTRNGTYNVSLTVYNPSCGSESSGNKTTKQITVYEYLNASIDYSPKCGSFPLSVQFADNSTDSPDDWYWRFYYSNGTYVDVNHVRNPVFVYPEPGTYWVRFATTNLQAAWDIRDYYITLTDCLQANFTANQTRGYYPFTVNFTDTSTPLNSVNTRVWNFGDQTQGSGVIENHTFTQKGTYNVSLTVTNTSSELTKVANKTIEVGSPVYANFTPNGSTVVPVNTSMVVKFTDLSAPQSDITNWSWNFDDQLPNDTNQSPSHQFTVEGWHNVTLNVSNPYYGAWNVSRSMINVSVLKSPVAEFTTVPDVGEAGIGNVTFISTSTPSDISAWYWDFGDGSTSTDPSPHHQYQYAGTYPVYLNVTNAYGNGNITHNLKVRGAVIADFVTDPSGEWGVINQPITFIDASKGQPIHWIWNFGDGNSTTTDSSSIVHTYTSANNYIVNMTATNWDGQSGSTTEQIKIENKSTPRDVNFELPVMKYAVKPGEMIQFNQTTPNQSNVLDWYWDFGDNSNYFGNRTDSMAQSPTHIYTKPGEYSVTLTARNDMGVNEKTRVAYVVVMA